MKILIVNEILSLGAELLTDELYRRMYLSAS